MSLSNTKTKKIGKDSKITINKKGVTLETKNKIGKVSIDSKGKASVDLKTPIEGLTFKKCINIFKKSKKADNMKKNNKGFTLVEVIGVLVILIVIFMIAYPAVTAILDDSSKTISEAEKTVVIDATKEYLNEKKNIYTIDNNNTYCITFEDLINNGYLSEKEVATLSEDYSTVQVTYDNNEAVYRITGAGCNEVFVNARLALKGSKTVKLSLADSGAIREYTEPGLKFYKNQDKTGTDLDFTITNPSVIPGLSVTSKSKNTENVLNCNASSYCVPQTSIDVYTIKYQYNAADGKIYYAERNVKIVDEEPPVITVNNPDVVIGESVRSYDVKSGVTVTDNSGEVIELKAKSNLQLGQAGVYVVTYTATDSSGNTATATRRITINASKIITFKNTTASANIEINSATYLEKDILTGISAYDQENKSYMSSLTYTVRRNDKSVSGVDTSVLGQNVITYKVEIDSTDYTTTRVINVVDTTAPVIVLTNDTVYTQESIVTQSMLDSGVTVTDNSKEKITFTTTGSLTFTDNKTVITYNAEDSSGNQATPVTRTFIKFNSAGAPVLSEGSSNYVNTSSSVRIIEEATSEEPITKYQYYISTSATTQAGGEWTDMTSKDSPIVVSSNGEWYVYARAVTASGTGAISAPSVIKIDKTIPTSPVLTGGSDEWNTNIAGKTISVETDAETGPSGLKNYQYYISTSSSSLTGGKWIDLTPGVKSNAVSADGEYYVYYRGVSNAGTSGSASTSQRVRNEITDPTAPVLAGVSDSWIKAGGDKKVTISEQSKAASGIARYEYKVFKTWPFDDYYSNYMTWLSYIVGSDKTWGTAANLTDIATYSDTADYLITVRAVTNAGRYSSEVTGHLRIDGIAPMLTPTTLVDEGFGFASWENNYPAAVAGASMMCYTSNIEHCRYSPFANISYGDYGSGINHLNMYINGEFFKSSAPGNLFNIEFDGRTMEKYAYKNITITITAVDNVGNESDVIYTDKDRLFAYSYHYLFLSQIASDGTMGDTTVTWQDDAIFTKEHTNSSSCPLTITYYLSQTEYYKTTSTQVIGAIIPTNPTKEIYSEDVNKFALIRDCKNHIITASIVVPVKEVK